MKKKSRKEAQISRRGILPLLGGGLLIPFLGFGNSEEANKGLTKEYFVVIDSRDRNYDLFSSTSQYEIELNNVYKDIVSIELISAEIPNSFPLLPKLSPILSVSSVGKGPLPTLVV